MNNQVLKQQLQKQLDELPREISPERDLWPGIEVALQQRSQQGKHTKTTLLPFAWAASVVAAVLLTWVNITPQQATDDLVASLQSDFEQQKKTMLVSFGRPELTKLPVAMQQQLQQLASARNSIQLALAADENNVDLLDLLRWTQQQEMDLLKQLYSPQWQTI